MKSVFLFSVKPLGGLQSYLPSMRIFLSALPLALLGPVPAVLSRAEGGRPWTSRRFIAGTQRKTNKHSHSHTLLQTIWSSTVASRACCRGERRRHEGNMQTLHSEAPRVVRCITVSPTYLISSLGSCNMKQSKREPLKKKSIICSAKREANITHFTKKNPPDSRILRLTLRCLQASAH